MKDIEAMPNITTFDHALVEAGQFYGGIEIKPEEIMGAQIGVVVVETLSSLGLEVTTCTLIDDYHSTNAKVDQNLIVIQDQGFVPEIIFSEKEMAGKARQILTKLEILGQVVEWKNGRVFLADDRNTALVYKEGKLSCALLDAALYATKHEQCGGLCVTVLPEGYQPQQQATRRVLEAAQMAVSIVNVYYTTEGEVKVEANF